MRSAGWIRDGGDRLRKVVHIVGRDARNVDAARVHHVNAKVFLQALHFCSAVIPRKQNIPMARTRCEKSWAGALALQRVVQQHTHFPQTPAHFLKLDAPCGCIAGSLSIRLTTTAP